MTDEDLHNIGINVVSLLQKKEFKQIAEDFDYAMRYGRPAEQAIEEDLERELKSCDTGAGIEQASVEIRISHFKPNDTNLRSLIECYCELPKENGILVELILTESGSIYLEDISNFKAQSEV